MLPHFDAPLSYVGEEQLEYEAGTCVVVGDDRLAEERVRPLLMMMLQLDYSNASL